MNMISDVQILNLLDATLLNCNENIENIKKFIIDVNYVNNLLYGICIYDVFLKEVNNLLHIYRNNIRISIVINFPNGQDSIKEICKQITSAISNGADEIDVVVPFYIMDTDYLRNMLKIIRLCAKDKILKIILETGRLDSSFLIKRACILSIESGADFLKTSTGFFSVGATINHVKIILNVIKDYKNKNNKFIGLKISGGINTFNIAKEYINLAYEICSKKFIHPGYLRIGSSKLLNIYINNNIN
jgi:deoxyribose-phosphate aldolase